MISLSICYVSRKKPRLKVVVGERVMEKREVWKVMEQLAKGAWSRDTLGRPQMVLTPTLSSLAHQRISLTLPSFRCQSCVAVPVAADSLVLNVARATNHSLPKSQKSTCNQSRAWHYRSHEALPPLRCSGK